jgi:hypothetical protein
VHKVWVECVWSMYNPKDSQAGTTAHLGGQIISTAMCYCGGRLVWTGVQKERRLARNTAFVEYRA